MGTLLGLKEQNKLGMVLFFHFVVLSLHFLFR